MYNYKEVINRNLRLHNADLSKKLSRVNKAISFYSQFTENGAADFVLEKFKKEKERIEKAIQVNKNRMRDMNIEAAELKLEEINVADLMPLDDDWLDDIKRNTSTKESVND